MARTRMYSRSLAPRLALRRKEQRLLGENFAWMRKISHRCPLCSEPFSPPLRLSCGHVFCRNCVGAWLLQGKRKCISCVQPIEFIIVDRIIDSVHSDPLSCNFINFYEQTAKQAIELVKSQKCEPETIQCIQHYEIDFWLKENKHCLKPIKTLNNMLRRNKIGVELCFLAALYARFGGGNSSLITWSLYAASFAITSLNGLRFYILCKKLYS